MVDTKEIDQLYDRLDELKAIIKVGENPFTALSYLKSAVSELMRNVIDKELIKLAKGESYV